MAEMSDAEQDALDASEGYDESSDDEGIDEGAAQLSREADDQQAAIEILRGLRGKGSDKSPAAPEKPAEQPAVAPPPPVEGKPAEPTPEAKPPVQDDSAKILSRLNNMERQLRAAEARTKDLEMKAAKADLYDRLAQEGNLPALAEKFGWSPEAILKYVDEGPAAFAPSKTDAKIDSVHQELQATKQELARERAELQIHTYKTSISREVPGLKESAPYLLNLFTDPDSGVLDSAGVADRIFAVQAALHNDADDPRDISIAEAAQLLNQEFERQYKRLHGKQQVAGKSEAGAPASNSATTRPSSESPNVVNQKPRISRKAHTTVSQLELEAADQEEALAILRSARRNSAASQQ